MTTAAAKKPAKSLDPAKTLSNPNYPAIPLLKTALPGPKAKEAIALDAKYVSPSYTRSYPFVIAKGFGLAAEDVVGNVFLDFTAGIAVNSTGYCHPAVVKAIKEAAENFQHMSGTDFYYREQSELARLLAEHTFGGVDRRVFFS